MGHFYSSATVPFIKALIVEMKSTFSLNNLAMTCLNPDKILKENDEKFLDYGKNDISALYGFYGKQRDDVFEGRRVTSLSILACRADSLAAEYNGYKAYVAGQRKTIQNLKNEERNHETRLFKPVQTDTKKRDMKAIEAELSEIKKKMCSPVAVENLLDDAVLSTTFPTIWRLLKVYVIIPFSEAIVERGFSKMNLIMTQKRCSLDSINLDALMQISFWKKSWRAMRLKKS